MGKAQEFMARVAQANGIEASLAKIYERCEQAASQGSTQVVLHAKFDVELYDLIMNNKNSAAIQETLRNEGLAVVDSGDQVTIGFDVK